MPDHIRFLAGRSSTPATSLGAKIDNIRASSSSKFLEATSERVRDRAPTCELGVD
jgi:hypothetical protein